MNKEGKAAYKVTFAQVAISGNSIKITPSGVPEAGTCGIIQKLFGTAGSFSSVSLLVIARNETSTLVFFFFILCIFLIATALEIC